MSHPPGDGHTAIVIPSLLDLFSPPPMLPPSPKSPSETPLDSKPPITISTSPKSKPLVIGGQAESTSTNGVGQYPSPPSHPPVPVLRLRLGPSSITTKSKEDLTTSLDGLKGAARSCIRETKCDWRQENSNGDEKCNAILGSYTLFRKHVNRHVAKLVSQTTVVDLGKPGPSYLTAEKRCGWKGCNHTESIADEHYGSKLRRHVAKAHVEPLQASHCPFKHCQNPDLPLGDLFSLDHCLDNPATHPLPWSKTSLRALSKPFRPRLDSPPALPASTVVPSYLTPPVRPYRRPLLLPPSAHRLKRMSRSRAASNESDEDGAGHRSLDQVRDLINPRTRFDPYFVENPIHIVAGIRTDIVLSSSIFPNSRAHSTIPGLAADINPLPVLLRNRREVDLKEMMARSSTQANIVGETLTDAVNVESSPFDDLTPISFCLSSPDFLIAQPRSGIHPVIQNPIQLALVMRAAKRARDRHDSDIKRVKMEGRADGVAGPSTLTETRCDPRRVERAARRHARVKAGKSYGIRYLKEKVDFEKRGEELGEYEVNGY